MNLPPEEEEEHKHPPKKKKRRKKNAEDDDDKQFYTLSFTYTFAHDNDVVYFAHCYPYSFSRLQEVLAELEASAPKDFLDRQALCRTLAGNRCDLLTITDRRVPTAKPFVVVTARVHPGETNASYIVEGLMRFLLSDREEADELRRRFVFKIVPMLNPDGVVVGNYRTSLAGVDLNRRWSNPSAVRHPTIYAVKQMLARLQGEDRRVVLYCDLHGHSRKMSWFAYGCENAHMGDG